MLKKNGNCNIRYLMVMMSSHKILLNHISDLDCGNTIAGQVTDIYLHLIINGKGKKRILDINIFSEQYSQIQREKLGIHGDYDILVEVMNKGGIHWVLFVMNMHLNQNICLNPVEYRV